MIPANLPGRLVVALPFLGERRGFACHHCTSPISDEAPYVPLGGNQRAHIECARARLEHLTAGTTWGTGLGPKAGPSPSAAE